MSNFSMASTGDSLQLVRSFYQGNSNALGILYKKHHVELARFGKQHIGNAELVKDIIQDAFLTFMDNEPDNWELKFKDREKHFINYTKTMMKNAATNHYRVSSKVIMVADFEEVYKNKVSVKANAEDNLQYNYFQKLIRNLDKQSRSIVELYIEGYSRIEIAQKLDLKPKTVSNQLSKARKKIETLWPNFMN